jgi:transposase
MTKKTTREKFTKEFKADAVNLVIEQGYKSSEVGRRLGVGSSNVSRWVREFKSEQEEVSEGGVSRRELETELRKLRKENKRLQMEREILKKAAAFFAKESN